MQSSFSKVIDPALYETDGLGIDVPLRVHKNWREEEKAALMVQQEWSQSVYPLDNYHGELGSRYHFVGATIPECRPDRFYVIAYANEFAFLYDDDMEKLDWRSGNEEAGSLLGTFHDELNQAVKPNARPERAIQAKVLKEMMAIDPVRAKVMMKSWATFVHSANRERSNLLATLDEYVPARVIDCGELIWFGFVTFGMALTIHDEDYELCNDLARPAYAALGLTNDLYSWEKERFEAEQAGQDCVFNAVWVIMKEQSVDETEAKLICRAEIRRWISEFQAIVHDAKSNQALPDDVKVYLEALLYSYMGNLAWSIECPRYKLF